MNKANEIFHSFQYAEYNINNYVSVVKNFFFIFMNISNSKFTENVDLFIKKLNFRIETLEEAKFEDNSIKPK